MCGWQPTATICPDSSVGRAADSYPAGQWFDPTSWHHLLYFHFISFHRPEQVYQNCSLYRAGSAKVACRSHKPKTRFESYARVHSRQGDYQNPWEQWSYTRIYSFNYHRCGLNNRRLGYNAVCGFAAKDHLKINEGEAKEI